MQVAPMHHRVRVTETRAEGLAQVDMTDFLRRQGIHQPQLVDVDRHGARCLTDAEIVEGMKSVGCKLDPGADLAQAGGFFEQDRANAFLRKPQRRGKTTDAAACDQNGSCACHQLAFPKCSSASSARNGTRDASLLRSTSCSSNARSVLRSVALSGCNIRACARSTDGTMSRNMLDPAFVR